MKPTAPESICCSKARKAPCSMSITAPTPMSLRATASPATRQPDRAQGPPGSHMSVVGAKKGVPGGRSRRCGWFDAALLKRSAQVNGLSGLCITKLDVLDGLAELRLCTGYE